VLPSIERTEPARTVIVPRVPPPAPRGRFRFLLPWLAFGAVAVAVVMGTTLWSVTLRSASRTASEPTGIDTAMVPAAPSVTALPTTPAAPVTSPAAVTTHTPVRDPKPRQAAPPPTRLPETLPVEAPPSAPPPTDAAPRSAPDPVSCADPSSCTTSSTAAVGLLVDDEEAATTRPTRGAG
jgi:hypothetical protein